MTTLLLVGRPCPRSKWVASDSAPLARTYKYHARRNESFALLSTVTYRSRAVAPMSELDLHRLARAAQLRNGAEGVTGPMVYDHGWIFQQLEGPPDGLARIWASIRRDRRHASIDVLSNGCTDKRDFEDWDLKLSVRGAQAGLGRSGMADELPEMIGRLCRGERPVDLLGVSWPIAPDKRVPTVGASEALAQYGAALSELIATVLVPRPCAVRPVTGTRSPSLSATLAALLIAVDVTSSFAFVEATFDRHACREHVDRCPRSVAEYFVSAGPLTRSGRKDDRQRTPCISEPGDGRGRQRP